MQLATSWPRRSNACPDLCQLEEVTGGVPLPQTEARLEAAHAGTTKTERETSVRIGDTSAIHIVDASASLAPSQRGSPPGGAAEGGAVEEYQNR